ncbi:hypothetical protein HOF56_01845 [Candidatus Peribacteria bacterium]|jgi:vacuolar-type H+-ATPase subunit C/Vma6|nr:hypothetical protein [Candidatus Peribacteria bacterium]MBT4020832.1 hypothetical protein [Candidatus Peribacteria bacterium]MBT4241121.1 hypothetical protein [Candidatus Peribacteria bacterium]MBT4473843.1 hypothetical protein [Candidatus Peribacteria bacterium]
MFAPPHTLGQHFAYALGRLGTLESELLEQSDVDRILGAKSGEEAVKMLRDINFIVVPDETKDFQEMIDATAKSIKENVEKMIPEDKKFIFDTLWIEWNRPSISFNIKKQNGFVSDIASEPESSIDSSFDPEFDESFKSPRDVDNAVAQACDAERLRLAKMSSSNAIRTYVLRMIDIEEERRSFRDENSESEKDAISFEQEAIESVRSSLDEMRTMFLGPEPIFAYAARAMSHLALLRVLLTGKVNSLEIQEIKSLLPPIL